MTKEINNFHWYPPNYLNLSDESPISYQVLKEEYLEYRFVGLPATVAAFLEGRPLTLDMNPFQDILAESLGMWCAQFANVMKGMIESTIQFMSVEVQVDLLTQTNSGG